jgi:hypothetical protein
MLDVLDRELERRGHRFARYADDCNIYVRSRRAGERVMANVQQFLARRLKLKINAAKSAVDPPSRRKFLGFSFTAGKEPRRRIAPQALTRFKSRVQELTRRTRGANLTQLVEELSRYLVGWRGYFGLCETLSVLHRLDQWVRRRLRAIAWKQWKHGRTALRSCAVAASVRIWRLKPPAVLTAPGGSATAPARHRDPNGFPGDAGPRRHRQPTDRLTHRTAVYGPVCTVVWEV